MICPSKKCGFEIDADSIYCDQCGLMILECSICGTLGVGKFCPKDGNPLSKRSIVTESRATPVILTLNHSSGKSVEIRKSTVLGRRKGDFTSFLKPYSFISGTHGQITVDKGNFFYTDLGSTNGSQINGSDIMPNKLVQIYNGDKINLADQEFLVVIGSTGD